MPGNGSKLGGVLEPEEGRGSGRGGSALTPLAPLAGKLLCQALHTGRRNIGVCLRLGQVCVPLWAYGCLTYERVCVTVYVSVRERECAPAQEL